MGKAVNKDLELSKRVFLLRIHLKVLLYDSKDFINHCEILTSFFFDILLSVPLLKVDELVWCCYGIAFRKLEIELADVNNTCETTPQGLTYILH